MMNRKRKALRIFVAALLILTLLAAVALPSFVTARKRAQRNACLNNLRMLSLPMTCCVPLANKLAYGDKLDPAVVCTYIKGCTMPACPAGGDYIVTWVVGASNPVCSVHGDLLFETTGCKTLKELEETRHRADTQQKN